MRDDPRSDWGKLALVAIYAGLLLVLIAVPARDPALAWWGAAVAVLGIGGALAVLASKPEDF